MAEILSLPAAPVAPAVTGMPVTVDGALSALPVSATEPFVALLATAQAMPVGIAAPPVPFAPSGLPASPAATDDAPAEDGSGAQGDGELDEPEQAAVIDPTLSPALAMLTALATAQPTTPRPSPISAKPRLEIPAKPVIRAANVANAAAAIATPRVYPSAIVATAPGVAALGNAPILTPANAAADPIVPAAMIAELATPTPPETPAAERIVVVEQRTLTVPASSSAALPTPIAITTATPGPVTAPSRAIDIPVVTDTRQPVEAKGAVVAETATLPEAESAVIVETTTPVESQAAPPVKTRSVDPRVSADTRNASAPPLASTRGDTSRSGTPELRGRRDATPDVAGPVLAAPIPTAPAPSAPDRAAPASVGSEAPAADSLVQRQLVIADDGRWLDSLAHDIARSARGETMQFRLEPVNLGSLTVAISQGSDGAAIRLTAETHRARDLLVDAQPALVAEARANGLRISETHVDLGGGNRDGNGGNAPFGGQSSFANANTSGQQAMRQDGNARRQPDLPAPPPNQPRSTAARAPASDSGERFA